jgi:hypothetical protein
VQKNAVRRYYPNSFKAFAFQDGVSFPGYVRGLFHDHILQRGGAFKEKVGVLRDLSNAVKAWLKA